MFCTNCGKPLREGVKFCTQCGHPVEDAPPQSVSPAEPPSPAPPPPSPPPSPAPGPAYMAPPPRRQKKGGRTAAVVLAVCIPLALLLAAGGFAVVHFTRSSQSRQAANGVSALDWDSLNEALHSGQGNLATPEPSSAPSPSQSPAPEIRPARITLVSADVSEYPKVKLYLRVEDEDSGELVEGLDRSSLTVREMGAGGQYLSREVRAVTPLQGYEGLNTSLIADKSDSISDSDMRKIQQIMIDFVNSLNYQSGDRAEVLAFDSIVQQMCTFTSDSALLVNGIRSMSTDGRTAFYDAVYAGISHASLQGGARCVIAFTDGKDNESAHGPYDLIDYANACQVPVYIIGVGTSTEESTLRTIAEDSHGRYWYIDDLYGLKEIFDRVYAEQKKLYVVEYASDAAIDQYAERRMEIAVSGSGLQGVQEVEFQPVRAVSNQAHASRYELFHEALTWEEANRRCQEMGGHLATITSQAEMDGLVQLCEQAGLNYVWLGGYTSFDSDGGVFGHWITGEPFDYAAWCVDEPSRVDLDGTPEWYIMLWNIPSLGGWTWNDQRNDPAGAVPKMAEDMGYICEYET